MYIILSIYRAITLAHIRRRVVARHSSLLDTFDRDRAKPLMNPSFKKKNHAPEKKKNDKVALPTTQTGGRQRKRERVRFQLSLK